MRFKDTLKNFKKHLISQRMEIKELNPNSGIAALLSFYRDERVDGCLLEEDADMLLYQWGIYDWGNGKLFELNVTRQLILNDGDDDEIWQMSLTFKFKPTGFLSRLGSGSKWCPNLQQLADFEKYINESMPYQSLHQKQADAIELDYECAG